MVVELALLTFDHDGFERKSRRINISDYDACAEKIRRDRVSGLGFPGDPTAQGVAVAQPVTEAELWEFMVSLRGRALLLYRCVNFVDKRFTREHAEEMALAEHEFVSRLLEERKLIRPQTSAESNENSSDSAGDPGKSDDSKSAT